ncbi:MAG: rhomboid family intramembrane serine protease [Mucilaginibacter sp.]|uniref:rhomboid family intramembrane serine protease n=1 Tax=Mucilaginibacter sp. TaxID=1882438 RepID=UPI003264D4D8
MNELSANLIYAPVASAIFAITLFVSLLAFYNDEIYSKFILHPYSVSRKERMYTLLTSGLIHKDWPHLLFNMMSYYIFAFKLEMVLGHWQFGLLYIVSLILSDLPTVVKHKDDYWYHSLGASGAISAVIFGFIMFFPFSLIGIMFLPFEMWAVVFGALYLAYCVYAARQNNDNINHDAHFYGALCGVFITIIVNHDVLKIFIHHLATLS